MRRRCRHVWPAVGAVALLVTGSCGPPVSPPEPLELRAPQGFPPMVVPADNPTTVQGVALGRQLFYDRRLSQRGNLACADCHVQSGSFSNPISLGILPHVNLAWAHFFLWDGRVEGTLEDEMRVEVEFVFHTDVARLREPDLEQLFEAAFGSREITTGRAAYALAQFERTLVSHRSRLDRYVQGDTTALSPSERRGMAVFYSERAECFHCHATLLFTDNLFHNNGLDAQVVGTGRGFITNVARQDGHYKTPTLRNVALTGPYMHDDRFATLEGVIDFYSDGVVYSETIDALIPNSTGGGMHLPVQDRADLVAFLRSLTDETFVSSPNFGP
ncbi:MAG: cytochrome c peroxidase, partial [Deltaproteobacteria bacterium]